MLIPIKPISEAENIIKLERAIEKSFLLSNLEVQNLPQVVMNHLIGILVKRKKKQRFEEMVRKNG